MLADPHFAAREALATVRHPQYGEIHMQNCVPKLSATPSAIRRLAPEVPGADNAEIYGERLGLSAAELDDLHAAGVL